VVSVNKYLRGTWHTHHSMALERQGRRRRRRREAEEASDTEVGWRKGEHYTKEINTSRASVNVVTIYPSNKATPPIGPVGWVG